MKEETMQACLDIGDLPGTPSEVRAIEMAYEAGRTSDPSGAAARLKEAESLLEDLEWYSNIGQGGYGCGICQADAYHRRGGDHSPDCRLGVFMKSRTTSAKP